MKLPPVSLYLENFFWETTSLILVHFLTVVFLFKRAKCFIALEEAPRLFSRTQLKSLNPRQARIKTGIFIEDFSQFDTIQNSFTAHITLWFKFNPKHVPLAKVKLFTFDKGEINKDNQPEPIIKRVGNELLVSYNLELNLSPVLNQRGFPVESHKIFIVLDNKALPAERAYFDASQSNFSLEKGLTTPEWKPIDHAVRTGFMREEIDKEDPRIVITYPRAVFSIDFMRRGKRNAFVLILPMSLIFYVAVFALILDPFAEGQGDLMRSLVGLGVPGFIAYAYVLATVVPRVSYFTLIDQFYMLYLSVTFVITFVQVLITQTPASWGDSTTLVRKVLFIVSELSVIIGAYLILLGPINKKPKNL